MDTFMDLIKSGGSVLIALAVLAGGLYLGYRYIWAPSQRQSLAIATANARTAESLASASKSNQETSKLNSATSEANARTAEHLERLTELVLKTAISGAQVPTGPKN